MSLRDSVHCYIVYILSIDVVQAVEMLQSWLNAYWIIQGLTKGDISAEPPLEGVGDTAHRSPEPREGALLELRSRVPCTVSFARGQEHAVHFALAGLRPVRPSSLPPTLAVQLSHAATMWASLHGELPICWVRKPSTPCTPFGPPSTSCPEDALL